MQWCVHVCYINTGRCKSNAGLGIQAEQYRMQVDLYMIQSNNKMETHREVWDTGRVVHVDEIEAAQDRVV